jgi:hypothetical protein
VQLSSDLVRNRLLVPEDGELIKEKAAESAIGKKSK